MVGNGDYSNTTELYPEYIKMMVKRTVLLCQ
jgi:hypothetical protein